MAAANVSVAKPPQSQVFSAMVASILGWSLDLFDLFILLYVAPVLATLFFPTHIPTLSLAAVYASFAVTLLMRPVGSAVFGVLADRRGRKNAMVFAVIGVGVATALLGALPTFPQMGVLASVIFLIVRLIQGVFVGGVVASTHTIGTETVSPKWRGLASGLIGGGGAAIGSLIASVAFTVWSAVFPGPAFAIWGWRAMFFTGILSTFLGLFVFRSLEESPIWLQKAKQQGQAKKSPLSTLFSGQHLPILLVNLLIVTGGGTAYYLTSGYIPTFLKIITKVPAAETGPILIAGSLIILVSAMLFGHVSEMVGRKSVFLVVGVVNLILIPFAYVRFAGTPGTDVGSVTLYVLVLSFLGNAAYAPVMIFLNERFPTAIRASGTGLSWNIGFAIGGMMPTFVTLASPSMADIPSRLAIFMAAIMVVYLIGAVMVPETKGRLE